MTGANDITIHDLRLGERVDSPTALKLPLDLAVALLTDSEGKIRAAVPVRGNLNNPEFDLGAVIREALSTVIVNIVSAPFRALAKLFGHDDRGEDPGSIESLATQRALERLVAKKADSNVVRDLAARYAKRTGEEPKRASQWLRNAGDPNFYKSMYAWLVESEPVSDDSMENLAASRANVVLEALRSAGADPARLEPGPVEASNHEEGKHIAAELSLKAAGQARTIAASKAPAIAQISR